MALIDRVHDISRVITTLDNKSDILRKEVQKMKAGGDPNAVAAAEQQASEAQFLVDHMKIELEELTEAREQLADSEDQLRDVKTQGRSTEVGHRGLQEVTRVRDGPGLNRPSFPRVWLLVSVGSVLGLIARRTFLRHRVFPSSAKNVVVLNAVVGESARLSSSPVRKLIHIVANHTLDLTSVDMPGKVDMYGQSLSVRSAWCRGTAHHPSLMSPSIASAIVTTKSSIDHLDRALRQLGRHRILVLSWTTKLVWVLVSWVGPLLVLSTKK
ncbi:hypothetical protein BHE74_00040781 [Ensete ventricosum]|nr:hypothetical protein BHE74_00040781 [Ensete ventricosum]